MRPERKNGNRNVVYKETVGNKIIIVTSRDPKTKVEVLKETRKATRKREPECYGVFSWLDK